MMVCPVCLDHADKGVRVETKDHLAHLVPQVSWDHQGRPVYQDRMANVEIGEIKGHQDQQEPLVQEDHRDRKALKGCLENKDIMGNRETKETQV